MELKRTASGLNQRAPQTEAQGRGGGAACAGIKPRSKVKRRQQLIGRNKGPAVLGITPNSLTIYVASNRDYGDKEEALRCMYS